MSEEFNVHSNDINQSYIPQDAAPDQKKSGCGCFMIGCLVLIALILMPIIGGGIYIATLSDAELGEKVATVLTNPMLSSAFKKAIEDSPDFSAEQKTALIDTYKTFIKKYDTLPKDKKDVIHNNIYSVIKKIKNDPSFLEKDTPNELIEILDILEIGNKQLINLADSFADTNNDNNQETDNNKNNNNAESNKINVNSHQNTITQTTNDPYSFDINATVNNKQPEQNKEPETTNQNNNSPYDF